MRKNTINPTALRTAKSPQSGVLAALCAIGLKKEPCYSRIIPKNIANVKKKKIIIFQKDFIKSFVNQRRVVETKFVKAKHNIPVS